MATKLKYEVTDSLDVSGTSTNPVVECEAKAMGSGTVLVRAFGMGSTYEIARANAYQLLAARLLEMLRTK